MLRQSDNDELDMSPLLEQSVQTKLNSAAVLFRGRGVWQTALPLHYPLSKQRFVVA
jgi:hypothetical protein